MAKIIALANHKGGVGKSTAVANISTCLALKGKRVLAVSLDGKGSLCLALGFDRENTEKSVYNVIIDGILPKTAIYKTKIEGLFIMPSSTELYSAEGELYTLSAKTKRLRTALSEIEGDFDYILIDCPPSLGALTANALVASNEVIIPILPEYLAVEGLSDLLSAIKLARKTNLYLTVGGVFFSAVDDRAIVTKELMESIKNIFGNKVAKTVIPKNIRIAEAPSHGVPVIMHDSQSSGAVAYREITEELFEKEEK